MASYQLGHGWERRHPLPLHHRLSAHAGGRARFFDILHGAVRARLRGLQLHPDSVVLSARRADRDARSSIKRVKLNVFLDVQNLTDRQNPEEIIYNYDFTVKSYITGFPTLAVLGARVEF